MCTVSSAEESFEEFRWSLIALTKFKDLDKFKNTVVTFRWFSSQLCLSLLLQLGLLSSEAVTGLRCDLINKGRCEASFQLFHAVSKHQVWQADTIVKQVHFPGHVTSSNANHQRHAPLIWIFSEIIDSAFEQNTQQKQWASLLFNNRAESNFFRLLTFTTIYKSFSFNFKAIY